MPIFIRWSTALAKAISPVRTAVHLIAKQHVSAVLHQGHKTDLRIDAGPATGSGTRESLFVGPLVGHLQRAASHPLREDGPVNIRQQRPDRHRVNKALLYVWLKPYIMIAAISSDMKK